MVVYGYGSVVFFGSHLEDDALWIKNVVHPALEDAEAVPHTECEQCAQNILFV